MVDVGQALRAFSLRRLVNKWIFRGKIHKDSSLFFFFFFGHFPLRPGVGLDFFCLLFFFFFGGGGGVGGLRVSGIVVLPGWIPLQGYYQIMLVFNGRLIIGVWGGNNSSLLFSIYNKSELYIQINMWLSNFDFDI